MNRPGHFKTMLLLAPALVLLAAKSGAQSLGLSVVASTNLVVTTNSFVTYTLTVTNSTGSPLPNVSVTNSPSETVLVQVASSSLGSVTNTANHIIFLLGPVPAGTNAQMTLTLEPTAYGFLTNTVQVNTTNTLSTNVVVQVVSAQADLGVRLAGPAQSVFVNDWMTLGVTVTNAGPDTVPGVMLSNTLPAGAMLIRASPAAYTFTNNALLFSLGRVTNGGSQNFQLTVQPANAGVFPFSSTLIAPGLLDANPANNSAGTNIVVANYLSTNLIATNVSAMTYDPQTGLMNQTVRLSNRGTNAVPSARVIVSGLTNVLFNAVGTNDGQPFVVYANTLETNRSVDLLLKYFVPTRLPVTVANSNYTALGVSPPDWSAPKATTTSTNLNITRLVPLPDGAVLLEFPSTQGRSYTVVYSDTATFTNARIAPPAVVAPADRTQWIDYGPPTTISAPTNTGSRFYRVFQNP
ncbi:MAG: DUF11 domain-containing protein [Verrucomicrobiota bacterium]|nr:DUF11 domain-containing protein [Verrucomicrobiota bacterium]